MSSRPFQLHSSKNARDSGRRDEFAQQLLLVFGSSISDGNRHNNENLPIVLAGRAGGQILPGRHLVYPTETPMANLLVSMAATAGVDARAFGDNTGYLRYLNG